MTMDPLDAEPAVAYGASEEHLSLGLGQIYEGVPTH
jgi:hypothetical protein